MSNEKDSIINSDMTEQTIKDNITTNSEIISNKEKQKNIKPLSQFEVTELIDKNEKLTEEVKNLKNQIVSLNDKINEQIITINNNKLK